MWLINTATLQLHRFSSDGTQPIPDYALLSHTWATDEVQFGDLCSSRTAAQAWLKAGYAKLSAACRETRERYGLNWLWADTACVDRSSDADIAEAVALSYRRCRQCTICLVYLSDVDCSRGSRPATLDGPVEPHICESSEPAKLQQDAIEQQLRNSEWMYRSWTLQELIAPENIQFYDYKWRRMGTKSSLLTVLSVVSRVDEAVLRDAGRLSTLSVARRMSWAASRTTYHVEDLAYSLLGIFQVTIPIIYGIGRRAFQRLQEQILLTSGDSSLLMWQSVSDHQQYRGLLANAPVEFRHLANNSESPGPLKLWADVQIDGRTITLNGIFGVTDAENDLLVILSGTRDPQRRPTHFGILLKHWNGFFVRCMPHHAIKLPELPKGIVRRINVIQDVGAKVSSSIASDLASTRDQKSWLSDLAEHGTRYLSDTPPSFLTQFALARQMQVSSAYGSGAKPASLSTLPKSMVVPLGLVGVLDGANEDAWDDSRSATPFTPEGISTPLDGEDEYMSDSHSSNNGAPTPPELSVESANDGDDYVELFSAAQKRP